MSTMIAGGGFAVMAWRLAMLRSHPSASTDGTYPRGRDCGCRPCREFYRITDSAWRAWNNEQLCAIEAGGIPVTVRL